MRIDNLRVLRNINKNMIIEEKEETMDDVSQWHVRGGNFVAVGRTQKTLRKGMYTITVSMEGSLEFQPSPLGSDTLTVMDSNESLLASVRTFWGAKKKYLTKGFVHKRGILLHGPAGTGKTSNVSLIVEETLSMGGVALKATIGNPIYLAQGIACLRNIEPVRPIVLVLEDFDQLVTEGYEYAWLDLLDGSTALSSTLVVATTNHLEDLSDQIKKRPSRFDDIIFVGYPEPNERLAYLETLLEESVAKDVADRTGRISMAHLKEVAVLIDCFDVSVDDAIARVSSLQSERAGF